MSMLKRMSRKRNSGQLSPAVVAGEIVTAGTRTSEQRALSRESDSSFADAPTPPVSPKPLVTSGDKAMTREEKIAMLLAKAAPRTDDTSPSSTSSSPLARSLTLPRGSSYNVPKSNSLATESSRPAPDSPRDDPGSAPSSPRKKLERSTSLTPQSPRPQAPQSPRSQTPRTLSTTLTLITSAVSSLSSPRGDKEKRRSRSNSFSGGLIAHRTRGTMTRIIYFASPMAVLSPPHVYLVPNEVLTEGMHAALSQAHFCEFGVVGGETGENEIELKIDALLLLDKTVNPRHKFALRQKTQFVGQPGVLAEYLQQGAPETCVAKTTITDEYIFKNAV